MTDAPQRAKRIFIVGCRRSGTTWTMLLLAQHPAVVALQQADFFRRLVHFGRWFESDESYGACLLTKQAAEGLETTESKGDLLKLAVGRALGREAFLDLARPLAAEVYDRIAACNPGAHAVVEQTPEYVQAADHILDIFPDACFLHVIRDPRSVFCSHRNAAKSWADPTRFSYDPVAVAEEWSADVSAGRAIAGKTERYMEVRYEDFRARSEQTLESIFEWAGLEADETLCAQAVEACDIKRMRGSSHAPKGFFRSGETAGWRKEMSPAEIQCVEYVAGDAMLELGYELVNALPVPPPFKLRLRRMREGAGHGIRRWAWNEKSLVRRGAARVLKSFPGVRRVLLDRLKRPA